MVNRDKEGYYYSGNSFADALKAIAIILGMISIVAGIIMLLNRLETTGIASIISVIVIWVLIYSDAEKIDLLNDIKENTEHLRDNIKKEEA